MCYLLTRSNLCEKAVWKRAPSDSSLEKLNMTFADVKFAFEYIQTQGNKDNVYYTSYGKNWKNEYYIPSEKYAWDEKRGWHMTRHEQCFRNNNTVKQPYE